MLFRFDDEMRQALAAIKERDGIPVQEQVRRAVLTWLATKDVERPLSARQASAAARLARLTAPEGSAGG
jgi:hypothetical protein